MIQFYLIQTLPGRHRGSRAEDPARHDPDRSSAAHRQPSHGVARGGLLQVGHQTLRGDPRVLLCLLAGFLKLNFQKKMT